MLGLRFYVRVECMAMVDEFVGVEEEKVLVEEVFDSESEAEGDVSDSESEAEGNGTVPNSGLHEELLLDDVAARVSVVDRLTIPPDHGMQKLEYGGVTILSPNKVRDVTAESSQSKSKSKSYADKLKTGTKVHDNSLHLFPLSEKGLTKVSLPVDLSKKAASVYQNTLYGYFLGPRLYFPTVQQTVKSLWGKFGLQDSMMNEAGFLFFHFTDKSGFT